MSISGFTFARNASKLYYPITAAIASILPIVDEFIVVLGDSDADDTTEADIKALQSDKIKMIHTKWDLEKYPRGMEHAHQTDIAKDACSGDWCFYLQADEVVHEQDLETIQTACERYKNREDVEGFLFNYHHFWGDYQHEHRSHGWYQHEIRIVRNHPDIHSWESAQSFRRIPNFDRVNYRQQQGTFKLGVIAIDAWIYHYGWVRPPDLMKNKIRYFTVNHKGEKVADERYEKAPPGFDYGPLDRLKVFDGTHPAVMKPWLERLDWQDQLQYAGEPDPLREPHKHEKPKYRILSAIEAALTGGKEIGGFKNYNLINNV